MALRLNSAQPLRRDSNFANQRPVVFITVNAYGLRASLLT